MKQQKPFNSNVLLFWVALIVLGIAAAIFFSLQSQAEIDPDLNQKRMMAPLIGIIVAGICVIAGTADRWFK